ncbi:tetratricopeptide repeat protein 5-like [Bolinopsis microptera]|uniref:tetratricopeptide repeat protein 5-like n=1 Tax=Bolinopsis microptera TaxID=2820187 RepID=UPI00307AC5E8
MEDGQNAIKILARDEAFYFKNNVGATEDQKCDWLSCESERVSKDLDQLTLDPHQLKYLKGCALNVGNKYNLKAEEILIDAAKMNPTMFEIWNELGDCIWKKGDKKGARNCFERALNQERNKVSLRNLSIVMRQQESVTNAEIEESVKISKEAVSLDVTDGTSWYILGNAYLAQFFLCGQASNDLKCSLNAYSKASADEKVLSDPDYHYNKGIVFKYLDDYNNAIAHFTDAISIHPQFSECLSELNDLKDQILKTRQLIKNKGKLKGKNIAVMLRKLKEKSLSQKPTKVSMTTFDKLNAGTNEDKAINCILISSFVPNGRTPFVCICLDTESNCFALNIYNIDCGKAPKLGDVMTVPYPQKSAVNIVIDNELNDFEMLRIDTPLNMMINNRQLPRETLAPLKLTTTALT